MNVIHRLNGLNGEVRIRIMHNCDGAALLPSLLAFYMERESSDRRGGNAAAAKEAEDVLVKVAQLAKFANLADFSHNLELSYSAVPNC